MVKGTCSIPGCGKIDVLRRGKCYKHYWAEHRQEREQCSNGDCNEFATRRGLCDRHYKQWQRLNNPRCSVEGCPHGAIARTYCNAHYKLWQKYGDPLGRSPRAKCAWPKGCGEEVLLARSESGMCATHAHQMWKKANPQKVNASNRRYNAKHPEEARAWRQKWADANPHKHTEYIAARRARLLGQFVERVYRSVVFKRDRGICGICYKQVDPGDWHLDHIIPISRGGEHSYANVQVTHPFCNVSKGAKILDFELHLA